MRQISLIALFIFMVAVVASVLVQDASAEVFLEDYEAPPLQNGQFAGTEDGDDYVGIFDRPGEPNGLRATWGESGAVSLEIMAEGANQFVRLGTDVSLAGNDPPGFEGFVGILDHPTVSFFTYELVGDFASLVEEPLYVGGLEISVDVRLVSDPGYPVYVRFLFSDTDDDEFVTRRLEVASSGWQTIRIGELSLEDLILLPSDGDGLWNGSTVFPVAIEVLIGAALPASGILQLDIDNFRLHTRCLEPIPGDLNNDCRVTFIDFAIMTSHWLECNLDPPSECW
jgi:hypothetical protein